MFPADANDLHGMTARWDAACPAHRGLRQERAGQPKRSGATRGTRAAGNFRPQAAEKLYAQHAWRRHKAEHFNCCKAETMHVYQVCAPAGQQHGRFLYIATRKMKHKGAALCTAHQPRKRKEEEETARKTTHPQWSKAGSVLMVSRKNPADKSPTKKSAKPRFHGL